MWCPSREERQAIYIDIQQAIDYMHAEKCGWIENTMYWENNAQQETES